MSKKQTKKTPRKWVDSKKNMSRFVAEYRKAKAARNEDE